MSAGQWFKKKWRKFYLKIVREKASPEYIARGWSIGMFFGCLIPIGGQLICSIPAAFLLKGSKIGAVLGTFITNQITVFFIYPVQCYAGAKLIGLDLSYEDIKEKLKEIIDASDFTEFVDATKSLAGDLTVAFFVGGAIMAIVLTPITYIAVKKMVIGYRIQLEKRRRKRLAMLRTRVQAKHQHDAETNSPA
ncbi:MAG: DUF2062 domain-containing protein [Lentisphaeria bacterium]|nr:DUF2062 domain-containing protein [Lentisphaeria bacterium]MBR3688866.1 DUF2062 domain-containing protein [Lentisphaeria bacterium]